jgi:hypothetical protein
VKENEEVMKELLLPLVPKQHKPAKRGRPKRTLEKHQKKPIKETRSVVHPSASLPPEDLPKLELPLEQIDKIHRGRKTTVLVQARREHDWEAGERIRLPEGTVLRLLKKERIVLGLPMTEDLIESEGFSAESCVEFARHLRRIGLRAGDTAFLYRVELSE